MHTGQVRPLASSLAAGFGPSASGWWAPRRDGCGATLAVSIAGALLLALLLVGGVALAQLSDPKFPQLTGRVVDEAGLIKYDDRQALEADLAALEAKSTDQIVVVTVKSLQGYEIEDYAAKLGRAWGIGQKGKDNGVLVVVAPNERKVRIEVGRRLEPLLPDGMTGGIIRSSILPAFRRGDFSGGIRAGVRDVKDVLLGDAEAVKERARGGGRPVPGMDNEALILLLVWVAIIIFFMWLQYRQAQQFPQTIGRDRITRDRLRRRGGFDDGNVIIIPGGFGGGWSGGGGGDGGFSGGGGDFGGGGASGSW